jgi:hypothetical protein
MSHEGYYMKSKLLRLIVIIPIVTLLGCLGSGPKYVTYSSEKYGFQVDFPSGWNVTETLEEAEEAGMVIAYKGKDVSSASSVISVGYLDYSELVDTTLSIEQDSDEIMRLEEIATYLVKMGRTEEYTDVTVGTEKGILYVPAAAKDSPVPVRYLLFEVSQGDSRGVVFVNAVGSGVECMKAVAESFRFPEE